jgi:hypothetical protein
LSGCFFGKVQLRRVVDLPMSQLVVIAGALVLLGLP